MCVGDSDRKLEDLVFGQRHVEAVQVEERPEQDDGGPFVAVAKGVVRRDTPEQRRRLADDVGVLVGPGVLRPGECRLELSEVDQRVLRLATEISTASA